MNIGELVTVKTIESKNAIGEKHTPYSAEIRLLSCVQQGDIELLITQLENLLYHGRGNRVDFQSPILPDYVPKRNLPAVPHALQGVLGRSSLDLFGKLRGIILGVSF